MRVRQMGSEGRLPASHSSAAFRLRLMAQELPRPLRFLTVGGFGLMTDLATFTLAYSVAPQPLLARAISLGVATLVTWRLNRAFTFDRSGRRPTQEALRYAAVAAAGQGVSYLVFAVLVLTVASALPQAALLAGAAIAALFTYNGHRLFAFRPSALSPALRHPSQVAPAVRS